MNPPAAMVPAEQSAVASAGGAVRVARGRARQGVTPLPAASIGGVAVGKHALEAEAERLQSITRRVGLRLHKFLVDSKADQCLPSEAFIDAYRYYQASVLNQLREQRERCKQAGGEALSTEALEAQFRAEVLMALRTFTAEDWAVADKVRAERFGGAWVPVVEAEEQKP